MKNLKKIFAIAMSVATVAMSTSAFAATYDAEATSVALTEAEIATLDSYAGQMTVVVVPKTFGEESTAADIYYINQDDAAAFEAIIADMGVKAELDGTKEWEVRIGGENVAEVLTFGITFPAAGEKITIVYGDVTADGAANAQDAAAILSKAVGGPLKAGTSEYEIGSTLGTIVYGDVTADNAANAQDAAAILSKAVGGPLKAGTSEYEIGSNVELIIE